MAKNFTFGNVTAGRDVNVDSTVDHSVTININYTELARDLQALASTPEEQQTMEDLSHAIEEHDESAISKILNTIADNAPLITKVCATLFKLIF